MMQLQTSKSRAGFWVGRPISAVVAVSNEAESQRHLNSFDEFLHPVALRNVRRCACDATPRAAA